jgi:hypothetical protein
MAVEPTPDTLQRIQTEINEVKAQHTDLLAGVRQRRMVMLSRLEASIVGRAHRIRDQLLTASGRHAAVLAAKHGLDPGLVNMALTEVVREALCSVAAGRGARK